MQRIKIDNPAIIGKIIELINIPKTAAVIPATEIIIITKGREEFLIGLVLVNIF